MKKQTLKTLGLSATLMVTSSGANENPEIFVSPDGNDRNKGTIESPFLTHARAKTEVWKIKQGNQTPINVYLRGGTYYLTETVVFGLEDSGTKASPITYQAYQDEVPVFTSTIKIKGWKKADNLPDNYPDNTRNKIWVAELPGVFPKYLFQNGKVLPRSTTRGFVPPVTHNS